MQRCSRILGMGLVGLSVFTASAATNALDTAGSVAYDGGWVDGSNGGSGFAPWILSVSSNDVEVAGHFVGTSTTNGFGLDAPGDTDIDSAGRAWGLYANNGQTAAAVRPLLDGPLLPGQTVSFHMDNGFIDGGAAVGGGLQNASGQNVFEVFFRGDFSFYEYVDASGIQTSTIPFTDDGIKVTVSLTSYATYKGRIESLNPAAQFDFAGTLMNPEAGPVIDRVRFFSFNAGGGIERNVYVNALAVDAASGEPPLLTEPAIRTIAPLPGNGMIQVTWAATNTARYALLTSTNLVTGEWTQVPGASGLVTFSDSLSVATGGGIVGFYRVLQTP